MLKYTFQNNKSAFFKSIKEKVDRYFEENKIDPAGNGKLYFKGALQIISAATMYNVLVFFTPVPLVSIFLSVALGLNLAVIGFNVMHEGGHQSFSRHTWINKISAYSLNVLGGNAYYWKIKHNVNHHTFTNIEGMDSDIDVRPFMRLHEGQPLKSYHRFQHVYWIFFYGISYLAWVFYQDFEKYFSGRISKHAERKAMAFSEHLIFWITKLMYVGVYIVVPVMMVGWFAWLIGFLIMTVTCGLAISIVFQLAHVVEGTQFYSAKENESKESVEWAIHQLNTTANFATSSRKLYWLLGGLNFQIEHHLFPRVSHIHYPALSRFVKESCREYNVAYQEYNSMFKAIVSHLGHLRRLGSAS